MNSVDSESSYEYITSDSSDEDTSQFENLDLNLSILNNYNIIYELGRGSFSIVWLAFNINDKKFYALKVQNPNEYDDGLDEISFVKKLPTNPKIFNNIIESFCEMIDDKKYLCSVWNLHASNIDSLIRKNEYKISLDNVKHIMIQLITALDILHTKFKVYHGDIKTDNILVKGLNEKDNFFINEYYKENFNDKYIIAKKNFWTNKGKSLIYINKINKKDKNKIRLEIHKNICEKIIEKINKLNLSSEKINFKYLDKIDCSLADFGTYCNEDNYYDKSFGTRYYQAPENILMGKCSYPVDIWSLGCTFYELLTNNILFEPDKDSNNSRDYYHLCLIKETCGSFPDNFLEKTKFYKNFIEINQFNKLNDKLDKFDIECSNILKQMLEIDPNKRITIQDLKKNNYFQLNIPSLTEER